MLQIVSTGIFPSILLNCVVWFNLSTLGLSVFVFKENLQRTHWNLRIVWIIFLRANSDRTGHAAAQSQSRRRTAGHVRALGEERSSQQNPRSHKYLTKCYFSRCSSRTLTWEPEIVHRWLSLLGRPSLVIKLDAYLFFPIVNFIFLSKRQHWPHARLTKRHVVNYVLLHAKARCYFSSRFGFQFYF